MQAAYRGDALDVLDNCSLLLHSKPDGNGDVDVDDDGDE